MKNKKYVPIIIVVCIVLLVVGICCFAMNSKNSPFNTSNSGQIKLLCDWDESKNGKFTYMYNTNDYIIGKTDNKKDTICRISTKDGTFVYAESKLTNPLELTNDKWLVGSSVEDHKYYAYDIINNKESRLNIEEGTLLSDSTIYDDSIYYKMQDEMDYYIYKYDLKTHNISKFQECHPASLLYRDLLNEDYMYITDIYMKENEEEYTATTTHIIKRYNLKTNKIATLFDMGTAENIDEHYLMFVGGTMYILSVNEDNTLYKVDNGKLAKLLNGYFIDGIHTYTKTSNAVYLLDNYDDKKVVKLTENGQATAFTLKYNLHNPVLYSNLWWNYTGTQNKKEPRYFYSLSEKDINTNSNEIKTDFYGNILGINDNKGIIYLYGTFSESFEEDRKFYALDVSKYSGESIDSNSSKSIVNETDITSNYSEEKQNIVNNTSNLNNDNNENISNGTNTNNQTTTSSKTNTNEQEFNKDNEKAYTKYCLLFDNGETYNDIYIEIEGSNIHLFDNESEMSYTGTFTSSDSYLIGTYTEVTYNNGGDIQRETINDSFKFEILPNHKLKDILGYGKWCEQVKGKNNTFMLY